MKQIKNSKAPGNDNISADLLKADGRPMATWLREIINHIWQNEKTIDDWTTATVIRIYKNKGNKYIWDNYRGMSLLVVASKISSRIILSRIQELIDEQLVQEQAEFRTIVPPLIKYSSLKWS